MNGSLEYGLKRFSGDLTGWDEIAEVVRFPLVAVEKDVWYLDGLSIRRDGPDEMVASVAAKGPDGARKELVFPYKRAR